MTAARPATTTWPVTASLVLAGALVGLPSLGASFQFDDWNVIVGDPRVHSVAAWWDSMPGMRPLLKLSYALNYEFGDAPAGFRAVNLLLHACNALLLYRLLAMFGCGAAAALTAAIFMLHPAQTETITYICGRSGALAASFALLSLLLWLQRDAVGRPGWMRAGALLSLALALAAKETAAVLPLVMLLCEVARRPQGQSARQALRLAVPDLAPPLLLVGVAALAGLGLVSYRFVGGAYLAERSILDNLLAQANAVSYLIGQLWFFDRLNIDPLLPVPARGDPAALARGAMLLGLVAIGLLGLRGRARWGFGVLWFFLWLAPTNSIVPRLDVVNDRQLYLALAGPAWLVAGALAKPWPPSGHRWTTRGVTAALLAGLLLAGLAFATLQRNRVYATEISLWQDVTRKSPHNARAFNNLGMAYALQCRRDDAGAAFGEAARLDPSDTRAAINRMLLLRGELPGLPARCAGP